ncbi:MAG: ABC transporter ATP-binding protein [Atopobiaceae bacterium]|jgi:ATP-binding cassette subfamily B multidrug efflux pump
MANPYAASATTQAVMANVAGNHSNDPHGHDDLDVSGYSVSVTIRRLMAYMWPYLGFLFLAFLCITISQISQLIAPILIGRGIDVIISEGQVNFAALVPTLKNLALVALVAAVSNWLGGALLARVSYVTIRDLREAAYNKLHSLPLSFIDAHAHGDLLSRLINDVDQVGDGLVQGFGQLFSGIITIAGTLIFMLGISWPVALVVVCLTPLSILVATLITRFSAESFRAQQALQGEIGGFAEEMISNQKLISVFNQKRSCIDHFATLNQQLYGVGVKAQFISSFSNPSTRLINNIIYAVVAAVGVCGVITGIPSPMTVGQVQSFLSYTNQYMTPFNQISATVTQVQTAFAAARRLLALLDSPDETPDAQDATELRAPQGSVRFDSVSFGYTPTQPLLKDITFDMPAGKNFALVGTTGCGKTTLINLLLRFYEIDGGTIMLDAHDTKTLTRESLRSAFGMVLQDTWLFSGTVAQNIAYGKPDATREEIVAAAKKAHAYKFIMQLPQGFDTQLTEGEGVLSQGQQQLLCIARVMLSDPAVLLLDEATSSIDTRTERQVQRAFDEMMHGRTSLVVAHRLSTIQHADCILVLKDGVIAEKGTHQELLAKDGLYAELYRSQFAGRD